MQHIEIPDDAGMSQPEFNAINTKMLFEIARRAYRVADGNWLIRLDAPPRGNDEHEASLAFIDQMADQFIDEDEEERPQ